MAVTNATDRWFLVDAIDPAFAAMRASAEARHKANWPHAELSVTLNLAGTQALVKVRGAKDWTPAWAQPPFVARVFTPADHAEARAMVRTPEWSADTGA